MSMSILDWIFLLIILFSVLQAIASGFVREFFAFAGVILAFLTAAWEYPNVAAYYAHYMGTPWPAQIAAFFTIFVAVVVLVSIVGSIFSKLVRGIGLRWFDRLLGAVFGFGRGLLVSAIIALGLTALAPHWGLSQSKIAPYVLAAGRSLVWVAPADFRQRFWDGWKLLRTVPEHIPVKVHQDESNQRTSTP